MRVPTHRDPHRRRDCPGLNAVIRAVVRAATERRWDVLGIEDATHGLIDLDHHRPLGNHWLSLDDVEDILKRGGTILGTSNKSDSFHYLAERNGQRVEIDVSDRVMENYRAFGLDGMVWVGGDGSMRIAQRMGEKGMRIVGVPKTIDLDLGGTDYSFGFFDPRSTPSPTRSIGCRTSPRATIA